MGTHYTYSPVSNGGDGAWHNNSTGQVAGTNGPSGNPSGGWSAPPVQQYQPQYQQEYQQPQYEQSNILAEYEAAQRKAEEEQRLRTEALLGQIDAQRPGINSQAEDLARQAYINQMLGGQTMRENLAAGGLNNTGYSESSQLGLQNAYQQALNGINQSKSNALSGLDQAKVDAQATGNADLAGLQAQYGREYAGLMQQLEQEAYNRQMQGEQMAWQREQANQANNLAREQWQWQQQQGNLANDRYNQEWKYSVAQDGLANDRYNEQWNYQTGQDAYNQQMQRLEIYLNSGMGASQAASILGLPVSEVEAYYNSKKKVVIGGRSAGGGSKGTPPVLPLKDDSSPKVLPPVTYGGQTYNLSADEMAKLFGETNGDVLFNNLRR